MELKKEVKGTFELWISVLKKPKETFKKEKKNASVKKAILEMVKAGFIIGLAICLFSMLVLFPDYYSKHEGCSSPKSISEKDCYSGLYGGLILSFGIIIVLPLLFAISLLAIQFIYWVSAKMLGGKGGYGEQAYLMSLHQAPFMPLLILLCILMVMLMGIGSRTISTIASILPIVALYYSFYLFVLALKTTHELSTGRAILAWLLPVIITTVLFVTFLLCGFLYAIMTFSPQ